MDMGRPMTEKDLTHSSSVTGTPSSMIDSFLEKAKGLGPVETGMPWSRLVFALDATMSRQPTWDLACRVQGEMQLDHNTGDMDGSVLAGALAGSKP